MFCRMDPPIEQSVIRTEQDRWLLGTLYICEVVDTVPNDAVAHWETDGKTYCIRPSTTANVDELLRTGDSKSDLCHLGGTSAAVWKIGGTYVKVKAWQEGLELEGDTIKFVNSRVSSIPTPEVIHYWVNAQLNRSFLVVKALEGKTLREAWESLSTSQRIKIAGTIAQFCVDLASLTSERLQTAHGKAIHDAFLRAPAPASEPSWKPELFGPYSSTQLQSILSQYPLFEGHVNSFSFYHADLGPTNILVAEDGSIVGVIDWESAAYYPKFWPGTKPLVSAGFYVAGPPKKAWADLLSRSLVAKGFTVDMERFEAWKSAVRA